MKPFFYQVRQGDPASLKDPPIKTSGFLRSGENTLYSFPSVIPSAHPFLPGRSGSPVPPFPQPGRSLSFIPHPSSALPKRPPIDEKEKARSDRPHPQNRLSSIWPFWLLPVFCFPRKPFCPRSALRSVMDMKCVDTWIRGQLRCPLIHSPSKIGMLRLCRREEIV